MVELGFAPQVSLEEGLARQTESAQAQTSHRHERVAA
jgi:hypothetical protein